MSSRKTKWYDFVGASFYYIVKLCDHRSSGALMFLVVESQDSTSLNPPLLFFLKNMIVVFT